MKVLLDYRPALRTRTGVGEYVHRTALALQDTAPAGGEVAVFSSSWKDRLSAPAPGIRASDARVPVRALNWAWHRLEWPPIEWLAGAHDIVHSPTPLLIPARRAAQVVTIHDLFFLDHPEATAAEVRRDYPVLVADHARRADLVVTVSATVAAQVVTRLGVRPQAVVTCHNGAPAWTARRAVPAEGPVICIGTLEPRKNVGGLLDAWEHLVAAGVRIPLRLAGGAPPSAAPLLARLVRPPLAGLVEHVGYVEEADRRGFYEAARLLVMPSLDEGFGLPVVEAMAAGVPVVASRRGALPEVCGDAAVLVEPDDPRGMAQAIADLLASPARLEQLRQRGVARAATFSWARSAQRLWQAYEDAVARRRAR
ncbi:glycosyl transferase family 1 [Luteitalea sp. TBR-22]|uniref:glycosyltransferase family 4 protein n=1 Tax=Luteitalea sp. TBR-22 TaxID=2802971 RepID=UPI001AF5D8A1|nr:glycosyltransferase family 1 protein [Luteitalea sp. TBR-22]BCS33694.1 glycosyl transferase family 1 [Luteitalea sp. TBR-22]